MEDIVENYKSGGAVRELVKYYNQCVANACTLSKKYVSMFRDLYSYCFFWKAKERM